MSGPYKEIRRAITSNVPSILGGMLVLKVNLIRLVTYLNI